MTITTLRGGEPPTTAAELTADRLRCVANDVDAGAIARLAEAATRRPLGLPPLEQCLTVDDHVAITVGQGAALAGPTAAGVIAALVAAGVDPKRIRVVAAEVRDGTQIEEALAAETAAGVVVETHDPANQEGLCFTGLTRAERPLLVNRTVFEADFVLPITADTSAAEGEESVGAYGGLYPSFFDQSTIDQFRGADAKADSDEGASPAGRLTTRRSLADEAGRLIGAALVVRAVPAADGGVAAVVAGQPRDVLDAVDTASREAWEAPLVDPADVVLAIIAGGPEQQSWDAVSRALVAAEALCRPGGAIAVWSDVTEPIPEELPALVEALDAGEQLEEFAIGEDLRRVATCFADMLGRGPVFLRSRRSADEIESLGFAPVANEEEMLRLLGRFDACTVVEGAQNLRLRFDAAEETP